MTRMARQVEIGLLQQELTVGRQLAASMLGGEGEEMEAGRTKQLVMLLVRLGDIARRHNALVAQESKT